MIAAAGASNGPLAGGPIKSASTAAKKVTQRGIIKRELFTQV
jgi:hypothetical protein